jgi:ribosomal protein S6--L-glutamate ligase
MRIVVIGKRVAHAYWRIAPERDFRSNIAVGGRVSLDPVPDDARELALRIAHACGWNDVGMDMCRFNGSLYVLEANMKYGREGFRKAGINYVHLLEMMIERREI